MTLGKPWGLFVALGAILALGGFTFARGADDADLEPPAAAGIPAGRVPDLVLAPPASGPPVVVIGTDDNELFEIGPGGLVRRDPFYVAIGKQGADKRVEGDERTPIGVYRVQRYIPGAELPEIYGVGAYPISYPNVWDRRRGRTGSGIWIHGTNKTDDELLPRSSRGCLTLRNQDFEDLGQRISVRSSMVVIDHQVGWTTPDELARQRDSLLDAVERWRKDWESLDTEAYLTHYADDFRSGGMNLSRWTAHKRRVNGGKSWIRVELSDLVAYRYPGEEDLFVVSFRQAYSSDNYNSTRSKSQFWRRNGDESLEIVVESDAL